MPKIDYRNDDQKYEQPKQRPKRATPFNIVIAGRAAKRWTNACHFCPRHFSAVSRHDRLQSGCDKRCTHVERGAVNGVSVLTALRYTRDQGFPSTAAPSLRT